MKRYVRFPLVLGVVALVSGALLSGTYHLTKEKIEQGKLDRQTGAIGDLFSSIDSQEIVEVKEDFKSKGVESIVKVVSDGKEYNCYTISFNDGKGGDKSTVIIALDSENKIHGLKFITIGDQWTAPYADKDYIAKVVKENKIDTIVEATITGKDLQKVLQIAIDCSQGKVRDPLSELFNDKLDTKEEITKPDTSATQIKKIYKVSSEQKSYYVFDVTFVDKMEYERNSINLLFALNEDGTFYRMKIVDGDSYANSYDMADDFDAINDATITANNLETVFTDIIQPVYAELASLQGGN